MDVHETIASRIRALRDANAWSLDALAERSAVSKSTISLIERGESSPTAVVLDKLATALGVPLASLFEHASEATSPPSSHSTPDDQSVWQDPVSGYVRRHLSPPAWSPMQLVEVEFPPRKRVSYDTSARNAEIHQQIWVIEGRMEITVGVTTHKLATGDCLAMTLDCPISFHNPSNRRTRYAVVLCRLPIESRSQR